MSTTPALFAGILDDAAMFPPGNATARAALDAHLSNRRSGRSDLIGPLLVPAEQFRKFRQAHDEAGSPPVTVALIGTTELPDEVPSAVEVVGFELPVTGPPLPDPGPSYQVACEVTAATDRLQVFAAVAEQQAAGRRVIAKYRTGGTCADAFPPVAVVAEVLTEAAIVGAPMKFTAGLHAGVRFTDPATGFEHHGFLNLMTAVLRARQGASAEAVGAALAERDPAVVTGEVTSWTAAEVVEVRAGFRSFGCCGVEDPVADLVRLGLLDESVP